MSLFRTTAAGLLAVSLSTVAAAQQLTVTGSEDKTTFYQLESSGRKNIVATDTRVALVWEQVHNGKSTAFVAFKNKQSAQFDDAIALDSRDSFSPVIAHCGETYYLAWIADEQVMLNTYREQSLGRGTLVAGGLITELTIACADDSVLLAWSRREKNGYSVHATEIVNSGGKLAVHKPVAVAPLETYRFQSNPGVAYAKGRLIVTWHDRTSGTNLLYASSGKTIDTLDSQVQINELIKKSYEWGSGSSAVRNTLAVAKNERLVAVWLDKRASRSGYKVYSAFSNDGGISWGDNYNLIDEWGEIVPQWTPAVASNGRKLRAVWMDAREDENSIWMAKLNGMSWSDDNINLSGNSGQKPHSPVIAFSPDGTLHAAWVENHEHGSLIRYLSRSK